jgi:hypothetical protein
MPIDLERLSRQHRYEDPAAGISEEFLERRLGDGRTLAILSRPLARPRPLGWVISPSIGPEHGNLRRLETLLARGLAGSGFPTLRLRPDLHPVHGAEGQIDVSARLADVEEAVGVLPDGSGVPRVGLLGAASGGMVAALVADRLGLPELALVEPVVRGKRYIRETIRRQAIAELIASSDGAANGGGDEVAEPSTSQRPLEELAAQGETFVRGLRLSREEYERICEIDLVADVSVFRGRSLVVGISPTGAVPASLVKLVARLEALDGEVTLETPEDPLPAPFGEYPFRNAGPIRIDTRLELDRRLTQVTTAWALGARPDGSGEDAA